MTDDGWRPANTAPYDVPVLCRDESGTVYVAWKEMLPPSRRAMWFYRPYPPRGVTGWRPIEQDQPTFTESLEAGLRMFKVGDRPTIVQRHDGYDLLLDMETRALVGVLWPVAPSAAKVEEMCARLAAAEVYVRKYTNVLNEQGGSLFADAIALIRALAGAKEKTDG